MKGNSGKLFERAKQVMPGGVNSPVRAYKSVNMDPLFIEKAKGNKIYDVEGNEYIDYVGSWGPMILGHGDEEVLITVRSNMKKGLSFGACTELEVQLAELICHNVPHIEMVRMVNSGTEAVMSAVRLARGFTKRSKLIKFEGCYHGHSDAMLVKAGSGAMTFGSPDSAGVTKGAAEDTLLAEYNNLESVSKLFDENKGEIACIIVEPVAANMGVVPPEKGFLEGLRKLCDNNDALLIFDEVITGFRLSFTGAAGYYGVTPDLTTYGKIIGGGMPVGAYGGRKDIMECVSPSGAVYQAGTLSGNPIAMTAGIVTLTKLLNDPDIYTRINEKAERLANGIREISGKTVNHLGSLICLFNREGAVRNYEEAKKSDTGKFAETFTKLIKKGIYTAPSQFEAMFLSDAFSDGDIDYTLRVYKEIFSK